MICIKKFISFILTLVFGVNALGFTASAEGDPAFYITGGMYDAGESINIVVGIKNSTELAGLVLDIEYDDSVFTMTSADEGDINGTIYSPIDKDPFRIVWSDATGRKKNQNGSLAVLNFDIDPKAKSGDYNFTLSYSPGNCVDIDGTGLDYDLVNGVVTVNAKESDDNSGKTAKTTKKTTTAKSDGGSDNNNAQTTAATDDGGNIITTSGKTTDKANEGTKTSDDGGSSSGGKTTTKKSSDNSSSDDSSLDDPDDSDDKKDPDSKSDSSSDSGDSSSDSNESGETSDTNKTADNSSSDNADASVTDDTSSDISGNADTADTVSNNEQSADTPSASSSKADNSSNDSSQETASTTRTIVVICIFAGLCAVIGIVLIIVKKK